MGDSDLRVLVAAGDRPIGPALERHMMKRIASLLMSVMLVASPGIKGQSGDRLWIKIDMHASSQ